LDVIATRLLKQLLRTLEGIERHIMASLDQNERTTSEHHETTEEQSEHKPLVEVRSILRLPVSVHRYYEAKYREQKAPWRKAKDVLEYVGVATAIGLAVLTWFTLEKVSSQADSAQKQVGIMQRQLEITDRPWIEISQADVEDFHFHARVDNGKPMLFTTVHMRVANVGHSAATNVRTISFLIFQLGMDPFMEARQKQVCDAPDPMRMTKQFVLFPGRDSGDRLYDEIGFDETIQQGDMWPIGDGKSSVDPVIIGCVLYDIPGSHNNPHHTGFSYQFNSRTPNGHLTYRAFRIGEIISPKSLVLTDNYLGVTYID
jgi:hypothetical protein